MKLSRQDYDAIAARAELLVSAGDDYASALSLYRTPLGQILPALLGRLQPLPEEILEPGLLVHQVVDQFCPVGHHALGAQVGQRQQGRARVQVRQRRLFRQLRAASK